MSMQGRAQFTPGPWELSSTHRDAQYIDEPKAEELRPLFRIHWDNDVTDHEAAQGASLIAAAPAMYEALLNLVICPAFNSQVFERDKESHKAWTLARAALAQAEGRQA